MNVALLTRARSLLAGNMNQAGHLGLRIDPILIHIMGRATGWISPRICVPRGRNARPEPGSRPVPVLLYCRYLEIKTIETFPHKSRMPTCWHRPPWHDATLSARDARYPVHHHADHRFERVACGTCASRFRLGYRWRVDPM